MKSYVDLNSALGAKYPFAAIPAPDGEGWEIVFPDVPGVVGFAESWEAIGVEARAILAEWLTLEDEDGNPLPAPDTNWIPIARDPEDFELPKLFSTEEAANELGISRRRVVALAKSRGVGTIVGSSLVFTEPDIDTMRDRTPGRPPKHAGTARKAS
jgi:predicted RNase H-like HicB family nuclease